MLGRRDLLLLAVIFASMTAGILVPVTGKPFTPLLRYFMMALLFLSFLPLELDHLIETVRKQWKDVAGFAVTRLVVLPVAVFVLFKATVPEYALAALLLAGVSTGVVSPFFALLVPLRMVGGKGGG